MIPEKIYLDPDSIIYEINGLEVDDTLMILGVGLTPVDGEIEYTRTPITKRFADEKPIDGQLIMCRFINNGHHWSLLKWFDNFSKAIQINDYEWFPVILPVIEEK